MRLRWLGLLLVLTLAGWAQTAPDATATGDSADKKDSCACCEKMGAADHGKMAGDRSIGEDQKTTHAQCQHMKQGKCDMAACDSKDSHCCMHTEDAKSADSSDKTGCCSHMHDKGKEAGMHCCGGSKCDRHAHEGGSI
jgi:hypothetical protein